MRIENLRINFDRFADYVPLLSFINNSINLIQQRIFHSKSAPIGSYKAYLKAKRVKVCTLHMIPFAKLIRKIFQSDKPKTTKSTQEESISSSTISEHSPNPALTDPDFEGDETIMTQLNEMGGFIPYTVKWKACFQWMKDYTAKIDRTQPHPREIKVKINQSDVINGIEFLPQELIWEPLTGAFKVRIQYEVKGIKRDKIFTLPEGRGNRSIDHYVGCSYEPSTDTLIKCYTLKRHRLNRAFNLSVLGRMIDQVINLDLP